MQGYEMKEERRVKLKQLIKEAVKIVDEEVSVGMRCSEYPLLDTCEIMFCECMAMWDVE